MLSVMKIFEIMSAYLNYLSCQIHVKMCLCSCHVSGFQQSFWDVHCDTHIKLLGLKYIIIKVYHFPGMCMDFVDAIF